VGDRDQGSLRWEPAEDSLDGYPIRDSAPPLFRYATRSATLGGPGTASLLERYGAMDRSIDFGVPFGKGMGRLNSLINTSWRISGLASVSGNRIQSEMPNSLNKPTMHDEISRHLAPLRRWLR